MRLFASIVVFLPVLVSAQHQVIQVGAAPNPSTGPAVFIPPNITATVGSVITFNFSGIPGFHSVSQSSFTDPCNPLEGGFDSGFVQVGETQQPAKIPQWNLTVTNVSSPIWFYCKQLSPLPHCTAGMVGSINAPATGNTYDAFLAAAKGFAALPGQAEGGFVGIGASASAPPSPLNTPGVSGLANPTQAAAPGGASSGASSSAAASSGGALTSTAASSTPVTSGSASSAAQSGSASTASSAPSPSNTPSGAVGIVVNGAGILLASLMSLALSSS